MIYCKSFFILALWFLFITVACIREQLYPFKTEKLLQEVFVQPHDDHLLHISLCTIVFRLWMRLHVTLHNGLSLFFTTTLFDKFNSRRKALAADCAAKRAHTTHLSSPWGSLELSGQEGHRRFHSMLYIYFSKPEPDRSFEDYYNEFALLRPVWMNLSFTHFLSLLKHYGSPDFGNGLLPVMWGWHLHSYLSPSRSPLYVPVLKVRTDLSKSTDTLDLLPSCPPNAFMFPLSLYYFRPDIFL